MHHVLEFLSVWIEEQGSRTGPLLLRGAVEEESLVGAREHRSPSLGCTVIRAPWLACWRCPFCYEICEYLTLDRMAFNEVQLELSQLSIPLSNVPSYVGVVEYGSQWVCYYH
jgi:hypothetical protein